MENYQRSEFVAVVKILKVTPDPNNDTYHTLEIETLNRYKGEASTLLRINTYANTSCAFSIPENTTWLVFASMGDNNILGFGPCSGSQQIDRYLEDARYPRAAANYKRSLDLKQEVLSYLKKNELVEVNPYNLTLFDIGIHETTTFKGFDNQNRFAVYELDVNEDLSIDKVTALQSFDNPKLAQLFSEHLRKNARINNKFRKSIPTKTKLIMIYYYYPAEGNDQSFVSWIDV